MATAHINVANETLHMSNWLVEVWFFFFLFNCLSLRVSFSLFHDFIHVQTADTSNYMSLPTKPNKHGRWHRNTMLKTWYIQTRNRKQSPRRTIKFKIIYIYTNILSTILDLVRIFARIGANRKCCKNPQNTLFAGKICSCSHKKAANHRHEWMH